MADVLIGLITAMALAVVPELPSLHHLADAAMSADLFRHP
jgi:hypothetical protein